MLLLTQAREERKRGDDDGFDAENPGFQAHGSSLTHSFILLQPYFDYPRFILDVTHFNRKDKSDYYLE